MDNQQKFNELSAAIFSQLYDSFPIGTQLNIRDYPTFETEENSNIFFATIKFYIDEKFIRCDDQYYGGFSGIVLTSKGFSVLNATPPEHFASKSNLAIELKNAIETGKTTTIKALIAEVIKMVFS